MNKMFLSGFFDFTKKQRRGILSVLGVTALLIASQYIYPLLSKNEKTNPDLEKSIAILKEKQADTAGSSRPRYAEYENEKTENSYHRRQFSGNMFYFDPNTLDAAGWQRLGIRDRTIAGIQKYISKGGRFREPEALRKIWGLSDEEKDRLIPYIRIAGGSEQKSYAANYAADYPKYEKKSYEHYEKKAPEPVDINAADSLSFISLPGIGPGFSKRIINFRNKLGGFYKTEQIAEVYGLPDSVFQKIKPLLKIGGNNIRKININTATNDELKAHSYIRWQLANVICEYRKQHGEFKTLEDLKKIIIINDETYNKIAPYLTL